ncbi:MAG: nuclear transport factor 2 family protein [Pseudomonadota bacterium]
MSAGDVARINERINEIFEVWSVGDAGFDNQAIGALYDNTSAFTAFDTLMPSMSIMEGWQCFADNWTGALERLKKFECWLEQCLEVTVVGEVAWTRLILGVSADDTETGGRIEGEQQVTLIWRKSDDWRIVHEHLSGPVRRPQSA